jgi:hypothetical protein
MAYPHIIYGCLLGGYPHGICGGGIWGSVILGVYGGICDGNGANPHGIGNDDITWSWEPVFETCNKRNGFMFTI